VKIDPYGFGIDATEVTNADYALFLAAEVPTQSTTKSPSYCSWNETFVPKAGFPATCHGLNAPYDAIFDMSGNVAEWADRVSETETAVRGGSFETGDFPRLTCDVPELVTNDSAANVRADIGFRCCSN
jgi:formylglycine-generating enzyme required for sulfatase activity